MNLLRLSFFHYTNNLFKKTFLIFLLSASTKGVFWIYLKGKAGHVKRKVRFKFYRYFCVTDVYCLGRDGV